MQNFRIREFATVGKLNGNSNGNCPEVLRVFLFFLLVLMYTIIWKELFLMA